MKYNAWNHRVPHIFAVDAGLARDSNPVPFDLELKALATSFHILTWLASDDENYFYKPNV